MFKNILFVCVGNICRSPVAEAVLQDLQPNLKVSSAGIDAMVGERIDDEMQYRLSKRNIVAHHCARQLETRMVRRADLIIAMEKFQIETILEEHPEARGKVMLLGKWDHDNEIEDPFMRSRRTYRRVYKEIEQNVDLWCDKVFS